MNSRILIVDDHSVVRRGLKQILVDEFKKAEFGEASNAGEALERVRKEAWDAVVLDITMPGRSGLEALKEIKEAKPKLPVLVLSMHPEDQFAVRVLKSGASGYMTKESAPEELVGALKKVLAGGRYVSAVLAEKMASYLAIDTPKPAVRPRIRCVAHDRFRKDRQPDRRGTFAQRENREHLSHAHPGKNGHDEQRRADPLRHQEPVGGIAVSGEDFFHS